MPISKFYREMALIKRHLKLGVRLSALTTAERIRAVEGATRAVIHELTWTLRSKADQEREARRQQRKNWKRQTSRMTQTVRS